MRHPLVLCFALLSSNAAIAQENQEYDSALAVVLNHTDAVDTYQSSDGSGEINYQYEEAETCSLSSVTNILLTLNNGIVETVSSETIELLDADPEAITAGQTDAYGGYVEINTRFTAATVRRSNYSPETCTIYCTNGEILKNTFQIQTDQPETVAAAVKTLALACARD
jgi:hypothetical protein